MRAIDAGAWNACSFKNDLMNIPTENATVYLTKTAVMETFKFVASLPAGSEIVFSYGILPSMLSESQRSASESRARRVAAMGEPWITHFDPVSLARNLQFLSMVPRNDL